MKPLEGPSLFMAIKDFISDIKQVCDTRPKSWKETQLRSLTWLLSALKPKTTLKTKKIFLRWSSNFVIFIGPTWCEYLYDSLQKYWCIWLGNLSLTLLAVLHLIYYGGVRLYYLSKIQKGLNSEIHLTPKILDKGLWPVIKRFLPGFHFFTVHPLVTQHLALFSRIQLKLLSPLPLFARVPPCLFVLFVVL